VDEQLRELRDRDVEARVPPPGAPASAFVADFQNTAAATPSTALLMDHHHGHGP
jgi:hypothetical protein